MKYPKLIMKPDIATPIDPTVRTAMDYQMIKRLKKEAATYDLWRHSRWTWLRKIATKAASRGQEIERYLRERTQAAMNAQGILAFDSASAPFSIIERFMFVTGETSQKDSQHGLLDFYDVLARAADDEKLNRTRTGN